MKVVRQHSTPQTDYPPFQKFREEFPFPHRPAAEIPDIPLHLDDLSDANLMALYVEYVGWTSYAKAQLALAEIEEERKENALEVTGAVMMVDGSVAGEKVTVVRAKRAADPKFLAARDALTQARAYRKLVAAVFDRCERSSALLSRELSRRISHTPASVQRYTA